ncbi:MAG: aminotransferase [Phycisphaerales bacterium]|nr:MAG: aminotransferase [Phycisphaerales bacterium]
MSLARGTPYNLPKDAPASSRVAERLRPFGSTIFAEMTALASQHGAINLSQGFPDEDGPSPVLEALGQAAMQGVNQYAPLSGLPRMRQGAARWFERLGGPAIDPDRCVTVTCGCTEAIASSVLGLLNPGDGLVVFEPCYDSYQATAALAGARLLPVTLRPDGNGRWTFDPAQLHEAFAQRPRAVLLNNPHNPTGKVFTEDELLLIADLCQTHDCLALCDEVYDHLVYQGRHRRLAAMPGMALRTVTMGSIGKLFSVTGWKVGWAIAEPPLTEAVRSAHQYLTFCANAPAQAAAAEALHAHLDAAESLCRSMQANARLLCDAVERVGLVAYRPQGGSFVMCDHRAVSSRLGLADDVAFCRYLTEHVGVAAIPPSAFYVNKALGRRYVRLAFCKKRQTIEAAIERLQKLAE